jgi:hypothetical protein
VAVAATSYLKTSIGQTQFTLDNAEVLLEDTSAGHDALREIMGDMEAHNRAARALHEALGQWIRNEQAKIDVLRADMEEAIEREGGA